MPLPRSVQICAPLFAGVLALTFSSPALAADTTAPVLVDAEGYQCLEVDVLFTRSTDTVTPQHDLMYKIYADGSFIGWSDDHGSYSVIWAAAYATRPGPSTITVTAVDAAGNESAASNPL